MKYWMLLATLTAMPLVACSDKDDEDDDEDSEDPGDTAVHCGSTQGFVYGQVSYGGDEAAGGASVWATVDGSDYTEAEMTADGAYELNLEGGLDWIIYAEADDCYSDDIFKSIEACEEYEIDITIDMDDCVTADKPNLYLYPEADRFTRVGIEHAPRQRIFASDPPYRDGWSGIAHTNGTFSALQPRRNRGALQGRFGEPSPFLFYEITLLPWQNRQLLQRDEGWCIDGTDAVDAMAELLGDYGFNAAERDDFVDAWIIDLPQASSYAVYPQLEVAGMAELDIEPALPVDRLWLVVDDGAGCDIADEPLVLPFDRMGAHGVEWGVVLGDIVR